MTAWSDLHSSAFVLTIRPGMVAEYKRRHAQIWPQLLAALRETGVVHYDIYLSEADRRVFGHMLRDRLPDPDAPEHREVLRWRAYMADVLEMDGPVPVRQPIERVFTMTAA